MQPVHQDPNEEEDDSENDPDYVPPMNNVSESDNESEEREAKRLRQASPPKLSVEEEAEKKRARDAAWTTFQASLPSSWPKDVSSTRMVKIEKRYRFAGEDVVRVEDVAEDSEDAKKWPHWQPLPEAQPSQRGPPALSASTPLPKQGNDVAEAEAPVASTSTTISASSTAKPPPTKRPGPRKPKTILAPLPGAQKAKKLTVLDKSAMDWKAHVQSTQESSELKDELQANRRGGGYLEKVEFLKRVEERKEEALEASKMGKRRR